jgi:hypothetical protein
LDKLRSNNWIVNKISREYNVIQLIHKLIQNSVFDHTDVDLEQYIYEYLLNFDNYRLNELYHNNKLRKFISQMIKNQRNTGKYYHNLKMDYVELNSHDMMDECTHNFKWDFVMDKIDEMKIIFFHTGLTQMELRNVMALSIVELYYVRNMEKWRICIELNAGMSTINLLLRDGKLYLRKEWEKHGDEYVEKINNITL